MCHVHVYAASPARHHRLSSRAQHEPAHAQYVSGIPVFQVSRYAAIALYKKKKVQAILDFMPEFSEDELEKFLIKRAKMRPYKRADQFFTGLSNKKLS